MIDTHCHLTYEQLSSRLEGVLARAAAAGVERMITIGTSIADGRLAIALCRREPGIRCAVGLHPHHAASVTAEDLVALADLEGAEVVLALGEMGLDYHYDFSPRPRQQQVFIAQLELARQRGRPIVIHCREAVDDCLGILRDFEGIPALFHCFTGSREEAGRILDAGCLIGLTGAVTFKRSEQLREIAAFMPADRLVVETDAPYLSPEPFRRQRVNEPALVVHTAAAIAKARAVSLQEIDRITTANAERFFRWAAPAGPRGGQAPAGPPGG
jgi:TatD DNase family protein